MSRWHARVFPFFPHESDLTNSENEAEQSTRYVLIPLNDVPPRRLRQQDHRSLATRSVIMTPETILFAYCFRYPCLEIADFSDCIHIQFPGRVSETKRYKSLSMASIVCCSEELIRSGTLFAMAYACRVSPAQTIDGFLFLRQIAAPDNMYMIFLYCSFG